jgi:glycosyltransferase involved in cell wall biosynthesis
MDRPLVLVVMPFYNARRYIKTAVESIYQQTYSNFVFLSIDDGSTDGSAEEIAGYAEKGAILWTQENRGPASAMNRAIQFARQENIPYLARMDADDISLPGRLEAHVDLLERYPSTAACSSNSDYIDSSTGAIIGKSTISTLPAIIRWEINHGYRGLIQGACTFRTQALVEIGGYRESMRQAEEVDLFLRLAGHYELRNTREFLYQIRLDPSSLSLRDTRSNVEYQFYALDCHTRASAGKPTRDFDAFRSHMGRYTRLLIWKEGRVLSLWRRAIAEQNAFFLVLASLLDPCRILLRVIRSLFHG